MKKLAARSLSLTLATAVSWFSPGCDRAATPGVQGYIEGEYVYVAAPVSGALETLAVQKGASVEAGDTLFTLDPEPEKTALDEARRRLAQGKALWEDMQKGRRPTEIEALEAQLEQAETALARAEKDLAREQTLTDFAASARDIDRLLSTRDQERERVKQYKAEIATANLGARTDQAEAASENVSALEAALAKAEWAVRQKRQTAPQAGLVFDTLYRQGEWLAAGQPAVILLPPENIKLRAFVPEEQIGGIQIGDPVRVTIDGLRRPARGKVSFISPRAEFTPPVIYSRESRDKLVFMIEATFDAATAAKLHPGAPADVAFD